MPIDVEKVVGAELPEASSSWDADDVILYHLGLGAGVPQTDANELAYTYEKELKVLPSFAVIPAFGAMVGFGALEGFDINYAMLLHGEQEVEIHKPIPTAAKVTTSARISDVFDKGKGALVITEATTADESGEPLFTNRFKAFIRGEGGFGGEGGPPPGNEAPDREPDAVVESGTMPQQALLYRLSGDKNPLHADPEFSKLGGFDTPILHGLCSFGVVCKAVVDELLDGDVGKVTGYSARFAGVVIPGDTIVTKMWKENGTILVGAENKERETPVITNAAITTS